MTGIAGCHRHIFSLYAPLLSGEALLPAPARDTLTPRLAATRPSARGDFQSSDARDIGPSLRQVAAERQPLIHSKMREKAVWHMMFGGPEGFRHSTTAPWLMTTPQTFVS